uniref:Uncharacterized protein n=1 Tax=Anopheles coluzzii TaxID=1518534 RepID=A0A8W7PSR4_ANOCL
MAAVTAKLSDANLHTAFFRLPVGKLGPSDNSVQKGSSGITRLTRLTIMAKCVGWLVSCSHRTHVIIFLSPLAVISFFSGYVDRTKYNPQRLRCFHTLLNGMWQDLFIRSETDPLLRIDQNTLNMTL